jgi:hypothetical protein
MGDLRLSELELDKGVPVILPGAESAQTIVWVTSDEAIELTTNKGFQYALTYFGARIAHYETELRKVKKAQTTLHMRRNSAGWDPKA